MVVNALSGNIFSAIIMVIAEEIPPENDIILTGENIVPKKIDVINVLKKTTLAPKNGFTLIIEYKTIEFDKPGFNQGKILGNGDSRI